MDEAPSPRQTNAIEALLPAEIARKAETIGLRKRAWTSPG